MNLEYVSYRETAYFSDLICDYLEDKNSLQSFHSGFPSAENLYRQALIKKNDYSDHNRDHLSLALKNQYKGLETSLEVKKNLDLLKEKNTLTITTGHQLSLMTGPLYFIYKIITTIKITRELQEKYPDLNYVPVYWMATEDHDFEEISAFVFQGKKFKWNQQQQGAVGKIDTASLESLLSLFEKELGNGLNASSLKKLIAASYRDQKDLTAATRVFVNHLFGKFGLLIIDGDDSILKQDFAPYAREELNKNNCYSEVLNQIEKIQEEYSATYKPQVNPREINLFYLTPGARYRITQEGSIFHLEGSETSFTSEEIENELANHPERFSPNVLMRPLYQEVVLPNIAYIGGGGELAYWLELKSFFNQQKVLFPLLCLRNSALLLSEKSAKKAKQLELSVSDLFLKRNALINKKVRQISNIELDLSFLKDALEKQFDHLESLVAATDISFSGAVKAQKIKQFKGVDSLEGRLLKAQKIKLKDHVERLILLHENLFPNGSLQELVNNFTPFYLENGENLMDMLYESFDPFSYKFTLITF